MAIFKRNRGRDNAEDNGGEAAAKKEKGSWRKPASTSMTAHLSLGVLPGNHRHCVQTATSEGMAAYPHS